MDPYTEDLIAWPIMVKLAGCVCTTLADRKLPGTCRCSVVPGPMAVMDQCGACSKTGGDSCGGQAWVRLVNEYPSSTFPSADQTESNCDSPTAYQLEVGIARCLPIGTGNSISGYKAPTTEQLLDATRLQMADKAAMKAAIKCCLASDDEDDLTYILGTYQPMQVTGDCGGGFWTVTVWSV